MLGVIHVINRAHGWRAKARSQARVFNHRDAGYLRLEGGRVGNKPRMIAVLAAFLAETDDLSSSRFAGDLEPRHLDSGCRARLVHYGPHRLHDRRVLIRRYPEVPR